MGLTNPREAVLQLINGEHDYRVLTASAADAPAAIDGTTISNGAFNSRTANYSLL